MSIERNARRLAIAEIVVSGTRAILERRGEKAREGQEAETKAVSQRARVGRDRF